MELSYLARVYLATRSSLCFTSEKTKNNVFIVMHATSHNSALASYIYNFESVCGTRPTTLAKMENPMESRLKTGILQDNIEPPNRVDSFHHACMSTMACVDGPIRETFHQRQ